MISNKFFYEAALLLIITSSWNTAYSQESKKTLEKAKQLTAIMLMQTEIDALKEEKIQPESLASQMLQSPSIHQVKNKSKDLLKNQYKKHIEGQVLKRLKSIPAEINTKEETWISDEWLNEQLEKHYNKKISEIINYLLAQPFSRAFERARESAVEKQKKQVILDIYPTPTEIEEINRKGKDARDSVVEGLKIKMVGQITLFDESRNWLKDKIGAIVDDALGQLRHQQDFVQQSNAVDCFTVPKIEKKIKADLDTYLLSRRSQNTGSGNKIYDIFPIVEKESIPQRAGQLMKTKFRDFISEYKINNSQLVRKIKTLIDENPGLHKTHKMSSMVIEKKFIPGLSGEIITAYERKAGGDKTFGKALQDLLNSDDNIRTTFNTSIKERLLETLTQARNEKSKEQLSPFREVISGKWQPPENKIVQFKSNKKEMELHELVKLLSIRNGERILETLLLESEEQLKSNITLLLEEGGYALDCQTGIADELKDTIKDEIKNFLKNKPGYNQITSSQRMKMYKNVALDFYIKKIAGVWKEKRKTLIWGRKIDEPFMDKKYLDLFERTKEYAKDVLTTDFFPDIQEPVITPTTKENSNKGPGGGGKGKGGGKGDGKGPGTDGGGGGSGGCDCPEGKLILAIIVCEEGEGKLVKHIYYGHNKKLLNEALYFSARKLLFQLSENAGMPEQFGEILRLLSTYKKFLKSK